MAEATSRPRLLGRSAKRADINVKDGQGCPISAAPHPGAARGQPVRCAGLVHLQSRRRRAAAIDAPAQGQPPGARRRAGRVRALGVGRRAQAQGTGAAAGGGGGPLCRVGRGAGRGSGCSVRRHDTPPPRRGRPPIGRPRDRPYDGRPGGRRTGSPPSPPPRSIRPAVRRLPRSPRLSGPGPHPNRPPPSRRADPPHPDDGGLHFHRHRLRDPAMASPLGPAHGRPRGPV